MSPLLFLAIALTGGLGAVCRVVLDGVIGARHRGRLPIGILVVNLTGSLLLGLLTGLVLGGLVNDDAGLVLGAGFLGGYTTFSTASVDAVRVMRSGRWATGALMALGTLLGTVLAAGAGLVMALAL